MDKAPWVFLRGLVRESRHWGHFIDEFAKAMGGIDCVAIDLPGNGRFNAMKSPLNLQQITDFVRAEAIAVAKPPYNIMALSLAGSIVWDWSMRYPGELNRIIVINSSIAGICPWYQRLQPAAWPTVMRSLLSRDLHQRERLILGLVSNSLTNSQLALPEWKAIQESRPVHLSNFFRQIIAAAAYNPGAQIPQVKALIIASVRDRLVSPHCSAKLANHTSWPLRLHPTAGHDLPLDAPQWLIEQVKAWCLEK